MKRIAATRIISFVLATACGTWCQSQSFWVLQFPDAPSYSPKVIKANSQELQTQRSLSSTSVPVVPPQAKKLNAGVEDASAKVTFVATGTRAGVTEKEQRFASGMEPSFATLYGGAVGPRAPNVYFTASRYPWLLDYPGFKPNALYHPSTSGSVLGRARYAIASVLMTRQPSGKRTPNTSHLLSVLTKAAIAAAYRPYGTRPRSPATMFTNAGSGLGGDFGTNLFHEFWPGIRRMLKLQKITPAE